VSEDTLASAALSTNTAWSHDVDEVLGTHTPGSGSSVGPSSAASSTSTSGPHRAQVRADSRVLEPRTSPVFNVVAFLRPRAIQLMMPWPPDVDLGAMFAGTVGNGMEHPS
jgi:hypothetical protein